MPLGLGAAEVDRRKGATRSAFVRLKRSLWERREIFTATKGRIYQAIVRPVLLYGCETWPLRAIDLRKPEVFDNDCLLQCRRIDRVPTTTLRRRLNLRPLSPVLLQCHLRCFGHAARRPEGELMRDLLLPASLPNWRKRVGRQLKTWASTIKDDLAALSGPQVVGLRRWNHGWLAILCDLAHDQRKWAAMVRDAVLAREEVGSARPGWKPIQVKSFLPSFSLFGWFIYLFISFLVVSAFFLLYFLSIDFFLPFFLSFDSRCSPLFHSISQIIRFFILIVFYFFTAQILFLHLKLPCLLRFSLLHSSQLII